jgi:hypothetical protein
MAEQVSITRRLFGYAILIVLIVAFAWTAAALLSLPVPFSKLGWLAAIAVLSIAFLNALRFGGVVLDDTTIKFMTTIVALLTALIPLAVTLMKVQNTMQVVSPPNAAGVVQSIDPRGSWTGRYTWHNFATDMDEEWAETVTIDTYDPKTGRFGGKAVDDDGQDTRIVGQEFENALVLYYISSTSIRPSFGSAALEFDPRNGNTLHGLLILKEIDQHRLMSGSYQWVRKTGAPTT